MDDDGRGCGPLHGLYVAARDGDPERMDTAWTELEADLEAVNGQVARRLAEAQNEHDLGTVQSLAADLLYREGEPPNLDGPAATLLGTLLYWFGYVASFVLFFRAHSREAVVHRLRLAYRTVGVDIRDTETVNGVERTVFRCPYRNLGADRFGKRHACHDVLDRVDDGYVTFLGRHRGLDYVRPRACAASECCYSEVSELG